MLCANSRKKHSCFSSAEFSACKIGKLARSSPRTALSVKIAALNRAGKKNVRGQPRQM